MESKIRVLIVDDYAEARESVVRLLAFESDVEVVGQAADGASAVRAARELQPDIVLMDINMPGMDGITATEKLAQEAPACQVIMMSVQGEPDYLRRSMLAGARDYLTKPFTCDELINTIRRVHELDAGRRRRSALGGAGAAPAEPAAPQPGKLLCLFSPKGGVGRTAVAVNLAIALRQATERKVALVDAQLQFGDVGIFLNAVARKTIGDLLSHVDDLSAETLRSVMTSHPSGVQALLAPQRPEVAELFTAAHLVRILEALRAAYDYVVVDCWTGLHETTLAVLDLADQILLLTTTEMPAIKNVRLFLDLCEALGYRSGKVLLVLNRADQAGGVSVQDLEATIRHRIAAQLPSAGQVVTAAINRGVPFVVSDPEAAISRSVRQLARQVARPEHLADDDRAEAAGGLGLGKLKFAVFGRKGA